MVREKVKWCENCAMLEKMYLDAKANNDDQVKAIREWQAKSAACEKHNAALREENARLTRERDEARAEVARLEGLILDWADTPENIFGPRDALLAEARRILAAKGE